MSLKKAANSLRAQGRGKDTELVHLTKREVRAMEGLAKAAGGGLTRNPKTGLPEAGFLDSLLPTILGFGATMIGGPMAGAAVGAATGAATNKNDPLMGAVLGGLGGYGGGQFAQGLGSLGAAAPEAAASAISNPAISGAVSTLPGSQAAMLAQQTAGFGTEGLGQLAQAAGGAAPSPSGLVGFGFDQAVSNPMGLVDTMGGGMNTAKAAGYAAAPLIYDYMTPDAQEPMKRPGEGERREFDYDAGYTGGTMTGPDFSSERQWFNPTFTRTMAGGGEVYSYRDGGRTGGGFGSVSASAAAPGKMIERQVQVKNASGAPAFDFDQATGGFSPRMETQRMSQGDAVAQYIRGGGKSMAERMKRGIMAGFARKINPDWAPPSDQPQQSVAPAPQMQPRPQRPMISEAGYDPMTGTFRQFAQGGSVAMESGGFVIPADVVSMAGGGSTDAGLAALAKRVGAQPIKGPGSGQSDDIPATIDGKPIARVANGEAYVPKKTVQKLGGARKLYKAMDNIRSQAQGHTKQIRPVNLKKALS